MKKLKITRRFSYNGMTLPDPKPDSSVEVAVKALAIVYPELAGAKIQPVEVTNDSPGQQLHTFTIKVGYGERG